jgi:hypothetical protein
MLFGAITCVGCMFTVCNEFHRDRHAVTHVITRNNIGAEHPEDGRVTPEICRGIDS